MKRCLAVVLLLLPAVSCAPRVQLTRDQTIALGAFDLGSVTDEELAARIHADVTALRDVSAGLDELETVMFQLYAELDKDRTRFFDQQENDRIRAALLSYLNYRTALLRMVAFHSGWEDVRNEQLRMQSFLVAYAAVVTAYHKATVLIRAFRNDETVRRKLNEADPTWGIPPRIFETVYANLTRPANVAILEEAHQQYAALLPRARAQGILEDERFAWIPADLRRKREHMQTYAPSIWDGSWAGLVQKSKEAGTKASYTLQTVVSELAGDTRLSAATPLIPKGALALLESQLRPGDIVLTRRDWYVSNGFLPGFWPHALLYVGSVEELEARGLASNPAVARHLAAYRTPAPDGHPRRFIEAVSEGVVFSSVPHAIWVDHLVVFRPRMSEARKNEAIARAFSHVGKRYDFDFDFFSTDKLVCTEVVYRAYDEPIGDEQLRLQLVQMMGRQTYPAVEFVRKFAREWRADEVAERNGRAPTRELELVLFVSGKERKSLQDLLDTAR